MSEENKDKKPKLPSFFEMARSFAGELANYVANGAPNVSHPNYVRRLAACQECPHLIEEKMRCGKCGCLVEHKAKWQTTTCPDEPSRWPAEKIKDYDQKRKRTYKTGNQAPDADSQSKEDS